jgi:hypothetical protein
MSQVPAQRRTQRAQRPIGVARSGSPPRLGDRRSRACQHQRAQRRVDITEHNLCCREVTRVCVTVVSSQWDSTEDKPAAEGERFALVGPSQGRQSGPSDEAWDSLGQTLYDQDRDAEIEAWVAAGGCPAVADRGRELMEAHP